MATQRLTIYADDGTSNFVDLDIPDKAGTYQLKLQSELGWTTIAGNFIVDDTERTYQLRLDMQKGEWVVAGTFKTLASAEPKPTTLEFINVGESSVQATMNLTVNNSYVSIYQDGSYLGRTSGTGENTYTLTLPTGVSTIQLDGGDFYFHTYVVDSTYVTYLTSIDFGTNYKGIIGSNAFNGASFTSVVVPKDVTAVLDGSFANCVSLKSFVFAGGSKLTRFGKYVFTDSANWTNENATGNVQYNELNGLKYLGKKGSPYMLCLGSVDNTISSFELSPTCEIIGGGAFSGCLNLTGVTIPKGVKILTDYIFGDCTNLTSVVFEEGSMLKQIDGISLFYNCSNLQSIDLPDTLQSLNCTNKDASSTVMYYPNTIRFNPTSNLNLIGANCVSRGSTLYLGKKLEQATNMYVPSSIVATTGTLYFWHSAEDDVFFDPSTMLGKGSSKATATYNVYTDNATIKDGVLTSVNDYTIVNVYHLDGTEWA